MQGQGLDKVEHLTDAEIRERVAPLLSGLGTHRILGAQLGELINSALHPHGTYRDYRVPGSSPKLRSFVERVLNGLVALTTERKGNDTFYEIVGAPQPEPAAIPPMTPDAGKLWRTFVAVRTFLRIVFDPTICEVSVAGASELPEGSIVVPSATLSEHREIVAAFLEQLRSQGRIIPALVEIEASYGDQSYPHWLKVLRTEQPPLDKTWGQFRHARLVELFKRRLSQFEVSPERIDQLATELVRDHQQVVTTKETKLSDASVGESAGHREKKARETLHRMIDRMSFEQLQRLELPFSATMNMLGGE